MKKLILLLSMMFFCGQIYCQQRMLLPDGVKCIKVASEIRDTMILINKPDADIINSMINDNKKYDSICVINDTLICYLKTQIELYQKTDSLHKSIIGDHILIQQNKDSIITGKNNIIEKQQNDLKKEKIKKNIWQTTTGVLGIVVLILLI